MGGTNHNMMLLQQFLPVNSHTSYPKRVFHLSAVAYCSAEHRALEAINFPPHNFAKC